MISSLLELVGFCALTYGTYVEGGRGPACFVAGFCLLVLGIAVDKAPVKTQAAAALKARRERAAKTRRG